MNTQTLKLDCTVTWLNPTMQPLARFDGVIHLFEHEYAGFTFWHGLVDLSCKIERIKDYFELGQDADLKLLIETEDGKSGLAKMIGFGKTNLLELKQLDRVD